MRTGRLLVSSPESSRSRVCWGALQKGFRETTTAAATWRPETATPGRITGERSHTGIPYPTKDLQTAKGHRRRWSALLVVRV